MEAFVKHCGITVALDRANVDTDQIIPKQFLLTLTRNLLPLNSLGIHDFPVPLGMSEDFKHYRIRELTTRGRRPSMVPRTVPDILQISKTCL